MPAPANLAPPQSAWDLIDQTTVVSLFSTLAILGTAFGVSKLVLDKNTTREKRLLFVWHAFDALIHFVLEGSFVYNCLFTSTEIRNVKGDYWPDPDNYLSRGAGARRWVGGAQAGGENPMAQLWMVYSKADRRWAGVDLTVLSIEIITVTFAGFMAVLACYDIARKNARQYLVMIILATAEIYGGYMTFMPEWLSGNSNLDTSNFMFKWIFLVFFNGLWVVIPLYAIYASSLEIITSFRVSDAFAAHQSSREAKKSSKSSSSSSTSSRSK